MVLLRAACSTGRGRIERERERERERDLGTIGHGVCFIQDHNLERRAGLATERKEKNRHQKYDTLMHSTDTAAAREYRQHVYCSH